MAIRFWLGVVQRDHVQQAVRGGFAQLNHGSFAGISRLGEADGLVYYSPRETTGGEPLKSFTAIGRVAPGPVVQAGRSGGSAGQWRRRMDWYRPAVEAPIRPLLLHLEFAAGPRHWGAMLRPGLLELSRNDWEVIRQAMRMPAPDDRSAGDRPAAEPRPDAAGTSRWY